MLGIPLSTLWQVFLGGGMKHPLQKHHKDKHGILRFVQNDIVQLLLEGSGHDLNSLGHLVNTGHLDREDYEQLMGLLGYSLCGYEDLSLVSENAKILTEDIRKNY